MADDVNANIRIDIDTSDALASLRTLQSQISTFNKSIIQSNASAVAAQKSMTATLLAQIGATKQFSVSMANVETSTSRLGRAIEKNKLSLGEYFRYGVASSRNFGRVFSREHTAIMDLAADRVKRLQTQYIAMGEAQNGVTRAMAVRPMNLFNADAAISIQRQQLFNKLLNDGSTSLINFGKNTQWAGRQLMVGFTVPLTIFGGVAGQIFMDLERQVINFRRVYGDAMTPAGETDAMVAEVQNLAKEFTKYGIAVKDTVGLASDVAAAGAQGDDLVAATAQSTRLATLGMIEMNQAMTATMALQTAFMLSNEELAQSIDFLNAVENQTVLSLDDVSEAIPRVAPVIKGLGGNVQDLAIFLTAMREGGVSAAEGANALKSGLASLINPTKAAKEQLRDVGININAILSQNKGDIRAIVTEFGTALGTLDKFSRQQTLAKVFGKYQFARLGALFENISREGSQAQRVVDLTGQSFEELNALAEKELSAIEESVGMKFTGAVERLKLAIAPIGEVFLRVATPIIEVVTKLLEKFNELSPGVKQFITVLVAGVGVVVPTVIMLIGLFGNFIGQAVKGFAMFNNFFNRLRGGGGDLSYLTEQELDAAAAAATLEGRTESLTSALNIQRTAVGQLTRAYSNYATAATTAATNLPQAFRQAPPPRTMATGGMVGGTGNKDTEPALLTPGEFVMNRQATERFAPLLDAMNRGQITELNDGSRLARTAFGDFQTQRSNSVSGVISLLSQLVNLSETDTQRVTEGLRALEQQNKLNRSSTEQLIKQLGVMPQRLSTAMVDAHVFTQSQQSITAAEAKRLAAASGSPITAPESLRKLDVLEQLEASVPGSTRILQRSDFVVGLPKEINNALKDGLSAGAFADAFETSGVEKWGKVIKMSGANAQDAIPEFSLLDAKVIELSRNAELAGLKVGDMADQTKGIIAFGDITKQAIDELESSGYSMGIVRQAVEDLEGRFRTFQVGINSELIPALREAGYTIEEISGVSASGRMERGYEISGQGVSPIFVRGQSQRERAPGAYGNVSSSAYSLGDVAISGINTATGSASESKRAQQAAKDVVDGFANELKRGIPDAQSAAQGLGNAAMDSLVESTSRKRRGATRPQGPAELTTAELEAMERKKRRAERKERGPATGGGGLSPLALREGEELSRIANISDAQDMAMREEINRAHDAAIKEDTIRIQQSAIEQSKMKDGLKKFGGALKNGSMKLTGTMFALDGLIFGLSMMNNGIGQIAQNIMPVVFGLQGLQMIFPMLMNPVGLAVAAIAAVAGGMWLVKKQIDDMKERAKNFSSAMYGAEKNIKDTAEFFGRKTFSERLQSIKSVSETGEKISSRQQEEASSYIGSEAGVALVDSIRQVLDTSGTEAASEAIRNNITRMILSGAISKDMGGAIAQEIGVALENQEVGVRANAQINSIIGPDGTRLDNINDRLQIIADITGDATSLIDAFEGAGLIWDGSSWFSQISMSWTGQGTPELFASAAIENTVNKLNIYGNELDRLEVKLNNGSLTAGQYAKRVSEIFDQKQIIDWQSMVQEGQKYFGDEYLLGGDAYDEMGQKLIDAFDVSVMGQLGEQKGQEFLDGFTVPLKTMASTGGFFGIGETEYVQTIDIDLRNVDQVTQKVSLLEQQIADQVSAGNEERANMLRAERDNLLRQQEALMNISLKVQSKEIPMSVIENMFNNNMTPVDIFAKLSTTFENPEAQAIWSMALGVVDPEDVMFQVITNYLEAGSLEDAKKLTMLALEGKQLGLNVDYVFNTFGIAGVRDAIKDIKSFNKLKSPITKEMVAKYWQEGFELTDRQMEAFMALPDSQKKEFYSIYRTIIADPERMSAVGAKKLSGVNNMYISPGDKVNVGTQEQIDESLGLNEKGNTKEYPAPKGDDTGGGGGEKEKSALKQMLDSINERIKLYGNATKFTQKLLTAKKGFKKALESLTTEGSIAQQLRNLNLSESLISDILSQGAENAQKIMNKLGKTGLKRLSKVSVAGTAMEQISGFRGETRRAGYEETATRRLEATGQFTKEQIKEIAGNEELAEVIALLPKGTKLWTQYINNLRRSTNAQENSNEKQIDQIKEKMDLETKAFEKADRAIGKQIDAQQELIDSIQEEIDSIEKLNEADQRLLRDKDRQIESYNREIDAIERVIEKEQNKIDKLKEEDDLRNRRASELSHELELLSQAEQEIRDVYQDRLEALDKVAEVNERILQQQRDQLNVSQALASGDIYEATRAAQEMRQNDIAFAQRQTREGLEAGMENQIAGLRTSEGLTREQAEKEIANIKEQSYQTSLLIQGIEDTILKKNKDIEAIKIKIRDVEDEKLKIEDRIYDRETLILDIQQRRLGPEEERYKRLTDQRNEMKKIYDTQIDNMEKQVEELELGKDRLKQINDLGDAWIRVGEAIAAANKLYNSKKEKLGPVPTRIVGESYDEWQTRLAKWEADKKALEDEYNTSVSGAYAKGTSAMNMNAGGMMKRYAAGSIVGDGSRDSIPAMLTPGEFVIRKAMVDKYGTPFFNAINQGSFDMPRYSVGQQTSESVAVKSETTSNIVAPMYNNYSVNVSVSNTNASADEIANRTIMKIKQMNDMQIRGSRGY